MAKTNQYSADASRLANLIKDYTGISQKRVYNFVMENSAVDILPCANILCETDTQRAKLSMLFEFKNVYETVKASEKYMRSNVNSTEKAKEYFTCIFADSSDKERVAVAFLDSAYNILATSTMFTGTVNAASIHMRELVKEALFHNAVSVVLAHNHPSGITKVSKEDISTTNKIGRALALVDIHLTDHIVVAGDHALSMADLDLIIDFRVEKDGSNAVAEVESRANNDLSMHERQNNQGEPDISDVPVYMGNYAHAEKRGEMALLVASQELNHDCMEAIDRAIQENTTSGTMAGTQYVDAKSAARSAIEEFGAERVSRVVAQTVKRYSYDGRLSKENKRWAEGYEKLDQTILFSGTHLYIFNSFVNEIRNIERELLLERDNPLMSADEKPSFREVLEQSSRKATLHNAAKKGDDFEPEL